MEARQFLWQDKGQSSKQPAHFGPSWYQGQGAHLIKHFKGQKNIRTTKIHDNTRMRATVVINRKIQTSGNLWWEDEVFWLGKSGILEPEDTFGTNGSVFDRRYGCAIA